MKERDIGGRGGGRSERMERHLMLKEQKILGRFNEFGVVIKKKITQESERE